MRVLNDNTVKVKSYIRNAHGDTLALLITDGGIIPFKIMETPTDTSVVDQKIHKSLCQCDCHKNPNIMHIQPCCYGEGEYTDEEIENNIAVEVVVGKFIIDSVTITDVLHPWSIH